MGEEKHLAVYSIEGNCKEMVYSLMLRISPQNDLRIKHVVHSNPPVLECGGLTAVRSGVEVVRGQEIESVTDLVAANENSL